MILGAGFSGLGAYHAFKEAGNDATIYEASETYGGLCGNFSIKDFRFDRFVHFTFAEEPEVISIFSKSCGELIRHIPNPYNIYKGKWIKHPAQNNLFPLDEEEKQKVIQDFLARPKLDDVHITNYEDWLRVQFGDYFAEHFPMVYTRKYWMKEARELRTEWVGKRVYQPSVEEVIQGSKTANTPVTYYAKEMRYPRRGGFKSLVSSLADNADICYGYKAIAIDTGKKVVSFDNGETLSYDRLISSLPLPEVVAMLTGEVPEKVKSATSKLECTSGYHISIALKTDNIPPYLWWYIYDEDILAARVYSPSLKSPDNAPIGCSSLQMEIYCREKEFTEQQLLDGTVGRLVAMNIIGEEDILFTHIGFEKYANVIFTEPIYEARKEVRDYLASVGIETIGRFGEWDYLWSNQSLLSGLKLKI